MIQSQTVVVNENVTRKKLCKNCIFQSTLPQNRKSQICQFPNLPISKSANPKTANYRSGNGKIQQKTNPPIFFSVKRQIRQFFYPPITYLAIEKSDNRQIRQFFFSVKRQIRQFFLSAKCTDQIIPETGKDKPGNEVKQLK